MNKKDIGQTDSQPFLEDDERDELSPELIEQYRQRFGAEPDWWVLGPSDDRARDIREAIRTGQPIVLNLPPGCDA